MEGGWWSGFQPNGLIFLFFHPLRNYIWTFYSRLLSFDLFPNVVVVEEEEEEEKEEELEEEEEEQGTIWSMS